MADLSFLDAAEGPKAAEDLQGLSCKGRASSYQPIRLSNSFTAVCWGRLDRPPPARTADP